MPSTYRVKLFVFFYNSERTVLEIRKKYMQYFNATFFLIMSDEAYFNLNIKKQK